MKPLLFNTEMVRAILEGRKTVTRRVVKPQPLSKLAYVCMGHKHGTWGYPDKDAWKYWDDESFRLPDGLPEPDREKRWTPPCHTGDILYVRETWCDPSGTGYPFLYKADMPMHWDSEDTEIGVPVDLKAEDYTWRPSIHMPKEAARLFLRVKDVKVERLQSITELDILEKEGITVDFPQPKPSYMSLAYTETRLKPAVRKAFADLWDSTIKPGDRAIYGWEANPWVWVIEFERCELTPELRKEASK